MKTALLLAMSAFGVALIAPSAASANVHCISFAAGGFCDAMQYNTNSQAVWLNYDCAGSNGMQKPATYAGNTPVAVCIGLSGCNPAAAYGWDMFLWEFNKSAQTGTLYGWQGSNVTVLQQDIPVTITNGACPPLSGPSGGVSSLSR